MPPARPFALACSAALLLAALSVAAQTSRTNTPAPPAPAKTTSSKSTAKPAPPAPTGTFEDFKGIPDRNIFNTRRLVGRSSAEPAPVVAPRRERVIESFSLLGTMQYEKGRLAFFEGSSPSHKKSVQVDEAIAGCKITAIEPSAITLEANGKPLELRVGFMLRREDDGAWETRVAERPSDYGSSSSFSSSSPFGGSSPSSSPFGSSSFFSRDSRSSSSSSRFGGGSSPTDYAQTRLREQDRNNDGKVSRDEADSRLRDRFREIDRNSDGFVDGEEYLAYYVARMGGGSTSSSSSSRSPFSSAPSSSPPFGNSSSSFAPPPSSSSPSSGGAGESELLRRLMEQRARENR